VLPAIRFTVDLAAADSKGMINPHQILYPAARYCRFSIPVLPAINMTVALAEAHVGGLMNSHWDCVHFCSPGVPEVRMY
jgi:hypothetical protein